MFWRSHSETESPAAGLGACGYPQRFIDALSKLETHARTDGQPAALILFSIDNLPMIMSGYSMAVAEAVMSEIDQVVQTHAGPEAHVERVQRDQFGILFSGRLERQVAQWCSELQDAIRAYSYDSRYGELHCLSSYAYQMLPDTHGTAEELLGRTIVVLSETGDENLLRQDISGAEQREEMGIANYLGQAVKENRLKLAYQPVIDSKTGKVAHYEALLRLFTDDGKISSAGTLIPIAERMGFMPMIDKIVLEKIIVELRHDHEVQLAVNVSNLTTQDPGWLAILKRAIDETPEIGPRLIVEITETAVHRDIKHMAYFCAEVQSTGALIALDDFGSGYTSFKQLKALSIDVVKIDGSFIRDLTDNADSRFFVKTLLDFTRGFGLKSVAEFVETGEIAKMLMDLGVDYLQGYYFGKPVNYRKWLKEGEYSSDN
jgi:EAL domain-containing protein (putative c-di-GMP-specific phosphodiesterase class I)/GGDEF domain-containing protein